MCVRLNSQINTFGCILLQDEAVSPLLRRPPSHHQRDAGERHRGWRHRVFGLHHGGVRGLYQRAVAAGPALLPSARAPERSPPLDDKRHALYFTPLSRDVHTEEPHWSVGSVTHSHWQIIAVFESERIGQINCTVRVRRPGVNSSDYCYHKLAWFVFDCTVWNQL